jgi:hypothetical protein
MQSGRQRWGFESAQDVSRFWDQHRAPAGSAQQRKSYNQEIFYLGLYLLALADHDLLSYPLTVEQNRQFQEPNFLLTFASGERAGLQLGRADSSKPAPPWRGSQAQERWRRLLETTMLITVKLLHHLPYPCDLLIYADQPAAVDRQSLLSAMHPFVRHLQNRVHHLGKASFVLSLDVLYDLGGDCRLLPFIQPPKFEDPGSLNSVSERIEYAARWSADTAVQQHLKMGVPVYSLAEDDQLVKQTPEGREYEVKFRDDGEEVVLKERPRK